MPYFAPIRKSLISQDLIDIYHLFANGQDTTQITIEHINSLADNIYKKSDRCDLIERCLIRFSNHDNPNTIKLNNEFAILQKTYEAQRNMISVQIQQIQELERANNKKTAVINELRKQLDDLNLEFSNIQANHRNSDILQGAQDMLSPSTRWLAKFFLSQEISKRVADRFRS